MEQTYIEYLHPGIIVSEQSFIKAEDRSIPKEHPKTAFAFRFYDRTEVNSGSEILKGNAKNHSHWYYLGGEVLTLEEVKLLHPDKHILISNMENNNIKKVVMTKYNQAIPLEENAIVI